MKRDFPETVLIAGVNSRPIVDSAKDLGCKVIAVDCFNDVDLINKADDYFITSEKEPNVGLTKSGRLELFELASRALDVHDIDAVILGSGLEHDPQLIEKLGQKAEVIGNDTDKLEICEDKEKLYEIADQLNIPHPTTRRASRLEEGLEMAGEIGYPILLKPPLSGGGIGIELVESPSQVEEHFGGVLSEGEGDFLWVQEYISGQDVSSSLLCDGDRTRLLTVNEQIIGEEKLDVPRRFGYCGNVVPYSEGREVKSKIEKYSKKICEEIGLKGSNGVDFVLSDEPYLLEVNPRFQNTFDLVEGTLGINLLEEHFRSFNGELTDEKNPRKYGVKLILYAKRDFQIPDLSGFETAVDVPQEGSEKREGEPICSVVEFGTDRGKVLEGGYESVRNIKKECYNLS